MADANTFPHVLVAATIPDLSSIHVAPLDFGATCWVISEKSAFTLTGTPTAPVDGINVVAPAPGAAAGKPGAAWEKGGGGGGGGGTFEGMTLAQLAVTSGIDPNSLAFVYDTEAMYRWSPGGVAPADGWITVNAPGGQWLLQDNRIALTPLGGGADDWPRLFGVGGAAVAAAAAGVEIWLKSGTWHADSVLAVPRDLVLRCEGPQVQIVANLPVSVPVGHFNSVFTYDGVTTAIFSTELANPAPAGAPTVDIVALGPIVIGTEIIIRVSAVPTEHQTTAHVVRDISGVGPFTITLDRPLLFAIPAAQPAQFAVVSFAKNIKLYGNGAQITGTGERAISLVCSWDTYVEAFEITGTDFHEYACSLDTGSYESGYERMIVHAGFPIGLALEACESCWMRDCYVDYLWPSRDEPCILLQAAYDTTVDDCAGTGHFGGDGAGILIGFTDDPIGSHGVKLTNCAFNGNLIGIDVLGSSQDVDIIGCDASYNLNMGVRVLKQSGSLVPGRVRMIGGTLKGNLGPGFNADGTVGNRMVGVYTEENGQGTCIVENGGELYITEAETLDSNVNDYGLLVRSGGSLRVESSKVKSASASATFNNIIIQDASKLVVKGVNFDRAVVGGADGANVFAAGGQTYIEDAHNVGATISNGVVSSGASTGVTLGPNAEFDGTTSRHVAVAGGNLEVRLENVPTTVVLAADVSTGSAAFVQMPGMLLNVGVLATDRVLATFTSAVFASGQIGCLTLFVDGVQVAAGSSSVMSGTFGGASMTWLTPELTAGVHTFAIFWKTLVAGGTVFCSPVSSADLSHAVLVAQRLTV